MHTFSEPQLGPGHQDASRALLRSQSGPNQCSFLFAVQAHHARRASVPHLYPRPAVFVGVAIHSNPVATTAQHVLWLRCSGVPGSQWSPQQHECVRERGGRVAINIRSRTWTLWLRIASCADVDGAALEATGRAMGAAGLQRRSGFRPVPVGSPYWSGLRPPHQMWQAIAVTQGCERQDTDFSFLREKKEQKRKRTVLSSKQTSQSC